MKVRPHVGALLAAGLAHEARLQIGEPLLVRSWVCADRDRVVAMKVRAIDQETAHAGGSHFAKRDLPRAGHAPNWSVVTRLAKAVISATSRDRRCRQVVGGDGIEPPTRCV
jgi:hypothetical protein